VLALAASLGYFAYTLSVLQQHLPAILQQVDDTTKQIDPVLKEIAATREVIPPILEEVAAVRKQIPPLLAEVEATRKALPPMLETAAQSIHEVNDTVKTLEPQIPLMLAEVKQTRESLPGLMTRAETLIDKAGSAGREASSGAVVGFFGGIISAPFKIIGGIGKGFANAIGLTAESGFTEEDVKLAEKATNDALKSGKANEKIKWNNPESKNFGTVTIKEKRMYGDEACYLVRFHAESTKGKSVDNDEEICQDSDGNWRHKERE
jgi:surface antigen